MSLTQGEILDERYRIVRPLSQGDYGAIYLAWDIKMNRSCTVKAYFDASSEAQQIFEREARQLCNLSHPNVVRVIDYFFAQGVGQFLVMDFIEGQDLGEMMQTAGGPLQEQQVVRWLSQVLDGLAYLHAQNPPYIHRDIKPANIIITPDGRAVLVDLGLARVFDGRSQGVVDAQTVTPGYSAPEQYGQGKVDARTDLYAVGATMYTVLTGKVPPPSVDIMSGKALLPPVRTVSANVSPQVAVIIERVMQLNPAARYGSGIELKGALMTMVTTAAPPPAVQSAAKPPAYGPPPPQARPRSGSRLLPVLGCILGVLILGILVVVGVYAGGGMLGFWPLWDVSQLFPAPQMNVPINTPQVVQASPVPTLSQPTAIPALEVTPVEPTPPAQVVIPTVITVTVFVTPTQAIVSPLVSASQQAPQVITGALEAPTLMEFEFTACIGAASRYGQYAEKSNLIFRWTPVSSPNGPVKYDWEIQVKDGQTFKYFSKGTTTNTNFVVPVPCESSYRWRVKAIDALGQESPFSPYKEGKPTPSVHGKYKED